ncbi:MAG: cytochrome c-type biogenesis protein CcmH [Chloroflexi bacterium]|nr:cytochrome c-type biogenesis protein CcmH [Chloroflexota bacterium]
MNRQYLLALAIFLIVGLVLFALLAVFISPGAQSAGANLSGDLDAQTLQVAKGLYCPVCAGVPLDVCETQACQQWRDLIKEKLSQGQTPAEIEAYFVQQYGERVLGAPRAQGINIMVYALPAFAVSAGVALLYLFAARRVKQTPAAAPAASAVANEYRSRIEQELKQDE